MANTYTWLIEQLDCYPTNPQPDCVFTAHWRCNAVDDSNPAYTATGYSMQPITYNPDDPYIPYADLTQDTVIGWVKEALGAEGVASVQFNLDEQILNLITPAVVSPPLPWSE